MKISKDSLLGIILLYIPDISFIIYLYFIIFDSEGFSQHTVNNFFSGVFAFILIRFLIFYLVGKHFYYDRLKIISGMILEFKKGRFITNPGDITGTDLFARILKELVIAGKHLDEMVAAQREEIDKFHEFYDSVVFSISSFFIVLKDDDTIVYANDGFCSKFSIERDEIIGKRIEDIFYFVNARIKGAINKVRKKGDPVVLERINLLSLNKITIIADIKVSKIVVKGINQIILILDDVTSSLRKDYQISLMSHISGSLRNEMEIDRVLHSILTAVTSGSGLGFNRAMLFLVDERNEYLEGKMAVGPDSFEEAIEIWSSINDTDILFSHIDGAFSKNEIRELHIKVINTRFKVKSDNIFAKTLNKKEIMHIKDSRNNSAVDKVTKELMEVNEFLIVPIFTVNNPLGVLVVDNKFNNIPIGKDSIELITIFASQAALSIESHRNLLKARKEMDKIEKRQEAIIESEKMAAVGRIATHIAHEIRNPLVTMGGYARRIVQMPKDTGKDISNIEKFGTIILNESKRLEGILSNVMDFTKPSKFIKEFNDINEIVKDTLDLLKNLFLERRIEIITKLDDEIPLVKSDFNQMKQVMLNLLQNSIEVTEAGGIVEIITEYDGKNVIIKVKDTGSGIDEEDPDIVFEPFFTKKISGVGLGLANVKKIIKDHNGTISVRNREYCGVEFKISLSVPV